MNNASEDHVITKDYGPIAGAPSSGDSLRTDYASRVWPCLLAASVSVFFAGCEPAAAPSRATVSLRLQGTPADAAVVIDDEDIGPLGYVALHGVALPPSKHHISVTAPGYFPWDKAVDAKPGDPLVRFTIALTPVPD